MLHGIAVSKHTICEAGNTIEHAEGIAHGALAFLCYYVQRGFLGYHAFFAGNALEVRHDIMRSDALEVKYLAAAEYGREYLVFFGCGKDEDGVWWRLFQCFEEGVKCLGAQHVHLINDVYFVFTLLGRKSYLVGKLADIIYGVIAGGIELENIEGAVVLKANACGANAACLSIFGRVFAVYCFCQYAGAGGFTDATWTAE